MRPIEPESGGINEAPAIVAEICARLMEWREVQSPLKVQEWLMTLVDIRKKSPAAMWLYVAWQTGNSELIAESFEERGAKAALDKQGVHQQTAKAFAAIHLVRPELAKAMRETFEAHAPEAKRAVI